MSKFNPYLPKNKTVHVLTRRLPSSNQLAKSPFYLVFTVTALTMLGLGHNAQADNNIMAINNRALTQANWPSIANTTPVTQSPSANTNITNDINSMAPVSIYPFSKSGYPAPSYNPTSSMDVANKNIWANQLSSMESGEGLIDSQQNKQMGEWALRQINENAPLISDPWLQQSLEQILWQINAAARSEAPLALVIINDRQINAFAVPSGLIGVNVGLLDKGRNLDEVASVISHEIAHVSQRHYENRNNEKTKQLLLQMGGMLAGIAAARSSDSNAGAAVMMGTQALSANTAAAFSRNQEKEADRVGMQIMAQAGYDVNAMPAFFATLDQQNSVKSNAFIPSFVMSHPLTTDRLSEARDRTSTYQAHAINTNNELSHYRQRLFDQMQWRARYFAHLTNKAELTQAAKNSDGAKLALAMQLMDEHRDREAQEVLKAFSDVIATMTDPLAVITAARLDERQGNITAAIQKLSSLANLLPERRDIALYLADLYLNQKTTIAQAQTVLNLLQPFSYQYPRDITIWDRMQQASQVLAKNQQGNPKTLQQINVLRYRANSEFWQNQLTSAVTSLNQAKLLANNLPKNRAIVATINQQLQQVQQANRFKPS